VPLGCERLRKRTCEDPLPVLQYWAEQGELTDKLLLNRLLHKFGTRIMSRAAVWLRQQGATYSKTTVW
jgi:transposase